MNRFSYIPLFLGLTVLTLSLGVAVLVVTNKPGTTQDVRTQAADTTGSLGLSPASGQYTFSATQTIPVGIIIDSAGKKLDGADIIITFDPKKVQIVGSTVAMTTVFDKVLVNTVDSSKGEIRLGALTFNPKPVTGIVGTFSIKPVMPGTVDLNFYFLGSGATIDSNLAENGTAVDVLGKIENASFNFK